MNYQTFSSDIPKHRAITFTSAEQVEETFLNMGIHQEMQQLGRGSLQADLAVRSTELADLFADRYSKACRMKLESPPDMIGLLFFRSANGKFLANGANVANDKLFFQPKGVVANLVTPDLAGSEVISIPDSRFNKLFETLCPNHARPECMTVIDGNTRQLNGLRRALLKLLAQPETSLDKEEISNLLAATIAWIGDSTGQWQPKDLRVREPCRRIAKLTEEYIQEHYTDAIPIEDICRVTGVGVRTLQRCFREYFDVNISEYISSVRLQKAHRELVASHRSEKTVSHIALKHGFTHLGRFSVLFRQRYGDFPSEVLALRAGCKS
jgi:AraC-like DNA-binding protein